MDKKNEECMRFLPVESISRDMDNKNGECMRFLPVESISREYLEKLTKDYKLVVLRSDKEHDCDNGKLEDKNSIRIDRQRSSRSPDSTSRNRLYDYQNNTVLNSPTPYGCPFEYGEKTPQKQIVNDNRDCPKLCYKSKVTDDPFILRDNIRTPCARYCDVSHQNKYSKRRCLSDSDVDEIVRPEIKRYTSCGSPVFEKTACGNTNSARKQLFANRGRLVTDNLPASPTEQTDNCQALNMNISRGSANKSPIFFNQAFINDRDTGDSLRTASQYFGDFDHPAKNELITIVPKDCDGVSAKETFERCTFETSQNSRTGKDRRLSFDETDNGSMDTYSVIKNKVMSPRLMSSSGTMGGNLTDLNSAKRKIDFDASNDVFVREEKRSKQTCTCALMEEQFMQMAEFGYRNIRRHDTSQESFEQFRRELNQTNGVLKESVEIIREIKSMCECRQSDRETIKRQLMSNLQFLKS